MRLFLVITLFITSLPIATPARVSGTESKTDFSPLPMETPTPSPTPTPDPVLEQARREAEIADELKKKAVADKERAAAEAERLKTLTMPFGTPSNVQIPTGNVQTDAAGWVESQMLAHEAARQITRRLVAALCNDDSRFLTGGVAEPLPPEIVDMDDEDDEEDPNNNPTPTPTPTPAPSPTNSLHTLVIYNADDLAGVELYNAVTGQLIQLREEFRRENAVALRMLAETDPKNPPPVSAAAVGPLAALAAPGIATGVIKSVAELLNLFRTETRFENRSVQISEDMVVSHLANNLAASPGGRCAEAIRIYYPALFPAKLVQSSSSSQILRILNRVERLKLTSTLHVEAIDARIKELNALAANLEELPQKQGSLKLKQGELADKNKEKEKACRRPKSAACKKVVGEIEKLDTEIKELEKRITELEKVKNDIQNSNVDDVREIKNWIPKLEEKKRRLQALVTATDLLSSRLNTPDADTKLTALAQLLRAEKLNYILRDPQTFTLRVAVTANGTTKIKKNLFVDAKVRHSAGANLVYQLFNRNGVLAQGDVMQCYLDYRSAQEVYGIVSTPDSVTCYSESPAGNGAFKRARNNNKPNPKPATGGQ